MIQFDLPKERSSIIKVIGVGGGGSNAVNHMYSQNIEGCNFIICNTDAQALAQSRVPNKIQLGPLLTQGLGAGANPDIGRQATEESLEEIKSLLEVNTKMAFITAGMGGGTGTGGAPILSKICKDLGILTVGIVTTPFSYEGKKRQLQAEEGIQLLKDYVDTLLVISNDKLRHQFGNLKMKEAFSKADNVLATAAKCITDVINSTGQINVDFADVCTVMRNGGVAILGSSAASGNNRAQQAIEEALNSPLLNDNDIRGAKWILININSAEGEHEFTMDEVEIIQQHLIGQAGPDTDVILGLGYDNNLKDKIGITIIATGFEYKDPFPREQKPVIKKEEEKIVIPLEMPSAEAVPMKEKPIVEVQEKTRTIFSVNALAPELQPKLVETKLAEPAKSMGTVVVFPSQQGNRGPVENPVEKNIRQEPIEWILSRDAVPTLPGQQADIRPVSDPVVVASSGGYLSRPSNIYAEEQNSENGPIIEPVSPDMQLVFKDEIPAADEPRAHPTQPVSMAEQPAEEPAMQDEAEGLKRRAAERINKLRNLSFNMNAADPNNEFENVPAYIRRNLELYNTVNNVETFYSHYEVKADKNNLGEISTINSFLDGKKPD
ncbi:MAG: cell division protein FtsZ [Bacteroidota bacterium]|nr:cell division protein FtsZ [Bacteroidota bacterium]MDP4211244.1 cell division protein FtsZ [Bacteroidota bacterium]MDP4250436.1 cell division protein FtsZ [Bacteroidota bacterium]